MINPSSVILSGVMLFEYLGWSEAARLIDGALTRTIGERHVTYDFARLMDDATQVTTSEFADRISAHIRAAE